MEQKFTLKPTSNEQGEKRDRFQKTVYDRQVIDYWKGDKGGTTDGFESKIKT